MWAGFYGSLRRGYTGDERLPGPMKKVALLHGNSLVLILLCGFQEAAWPGEEAISMKVRAFNIFGKNTSCQPINNVHGYARSDSTNATFPIVFVTEVQTGSPLRRPEETWGIPQGADFHIQAFFTDESSEQPGIDVDKFLAIHPNITFVCHYDGHKFVRRFSTHVMEEQIAEVRRIVRRNMRGGSGKVTSRL